MQVAAAFAVGATIEVTSGTATMAASPRARTISRLDIPASFGGKATGSSNR